VPPAICSECGVGGGRHEAGCHLERDHEPTKEER
jgi:hypothetical protein